MNKRRLLKLADLLEANAKNKKGIKFDLGTWGSREWDEESEIVSCGTTACAVGLAAISGAFKRQGLSYRFVDSPWGTGGVELQVLLNGRIGSRRAAYHPNFSAACKFFGLSNEEGEFLFTPNGYSIESLEGARAERYVAKRIRDLVAGKVSPPAD